MLKQYKHRPRDEAMELIETHIAQNGLVPHDKLPSERDMCDMWNLNRATLRSAVRRMIMEHRLYARVGAGTYVAPPKFVRHLQDMESLASTAEKMGRGLTTRLLHSGMLECNKELSQKMRLKLGHRIFVLQRLRSLDGVPTTLELSYVDYERCPGIENRNLSAESLYSILRADYGIQVTHGQENIGITYATEQEAELLGIAQGTPAFYVNGVACDAEDRPVECFKATSRADQLLFTSVLTAQGGPEDGEPRP